MLHRITLPFVGLLLSAFCLAETAKPEDPIFTAFKNDTKEMQGIVDRSKAGDRSLCPRFASSDYESCIRALIYSATIRSTTNVTGLLAAVHNARDYDKAHGVDAVTGSLLYADNVVFLHEKVQPAQLAINKEAIGSPERYALQRDVDLYQDFQRRVPEALKEINDLLAVLKQKVSVAPKSFNTWQTAKLQNVQTRIAVLEKKSWQLPIWEKMIESRRSPSPSDR